MLLEGHGDAESSPPGLHTAVWLISAETAPSCPAGVGSGGLTIIGGLHRLACHYRPQSAEL